MNIYVDSSTLIKRAILEQESYQLVESLEHYVQDGHTLCSSTLVGADLVVAYDQRLLVSAEELGFRTSSPGREDAN